MKTRLCVTKGVLENKSAKKLVELDNNTKFIYTEECEIHVTSC